MSSRSIATIGSFTAFAVATNYALTPFPNIKLMDLTVFVASYSFGLPVGVSVALLSWFVYGTINPWGAAGFPLILLLMGGECYYALAARMLRRLRPLQEHEGLGSSFRAESLVFGLAGLLSALSYDMTTNVALWAFVYGPGWRALVVGLVTMNFPLPFGIMHEVSDFFIFLILGPPFIFLTRRALPGRSVQVPAR